MNINKNEKSVIICGHGGDSLTIRYDNMGEPFRQGINLAVRQEFPEKDVSLFIEGHEVKRIRDLLNKLYPVK